MSEIPETIPEDVRLAASAEAGRWFRAIGSGEYSFTEAIARAILAERAACAKRYREGAGPDTWDYFKGAEDAINPGT